jgi:hypothetical protein
MQAGSNSHTKHENVNVRNIGQGEAQHKSIKGSNLVAVRHTMDQLYRL